MTQGKAPNRQNVGKDVGLVEKILGLVSENQEIKMSEIAEKLHVTTRTIEREMKKLRESGCIAENDTDIGKYIKE